MARTVEVTFTGDVADLSRSADAAVEDLERVERGAGQLGDRLGDVGGSSSQAAGGLGDLGGALSLMGGPLGGVGAGMESLAPAIQGVTGAADLLELATAKVNLANIKNVATSAASKAAAIAGSVATGIATAAQWALNAAMSANPIALVVIALVALTAAIVIAWQNSETFRDIVTGAFDAVLSAVQFVWQWVSDNWPLLLAILTGPIGLAVLAIVNNWESITAGFEAVVNGIKGGVDRATSFITGIPGKIREVVSDITSAGSELAAGFLSGLGDLAGGIGNDITAALGTAINSIIIKPINTAIGFINDKLIANANKVPFVDIPKIPNIPQLAKGGIVNQATLLIAGEAGAEAIIPLDKLNGFGGGNVTVNIYVPETSNPAEVGRLIWARLKAFAAVSGVPILRGV